MLTEKRDKGRTEAQRREDKHATREARLICF